MAGNDVYLDTLYPTNDVGLYDPTTAPLNIPVAPLGAQASTSVGIVSLTSSRIDVPVSGVQLIASAGSVTATTPITWVQGHILNNQGGLTLPLTGSVIQSGSTVVGAVTVAVSQTLVSVTDDKGNSYTIFDHTTDSRGQENYAFILGNITNGPSTITATFTSSSAGFTGLIWDEYSGVAALTDPRDGHVVNLQQNPITVATDAITSTPITTTINGDLIWGATINSNNSDSPVAGTGFTSRERDGTGAPMNSEDMVQTTAGSVAATFTPPTINGSQTTFVVALKPAISKTVVVTGVQANTAAGTAIGTNITFVQNATNGAISATTIAATGSVVGTGGCIAGAVSWGSNTIALSSVIDDKGNSYTISDNFADASTSQCMATFVRGNITNGPSTLTATFGSSATFVQLSWNEYSGVVALTDPRDGHTGQIQTSVTSTSADAITSGNITTTSNGDLIFAATMDDSGINPSAGTGFNLRVANNSGGNVSIALEDLIQVTAGTANGTFTQASQPNPWITAVMALKPAAAASGTSVNITGVAGTTSAGTVFANVQPNANGAQANSSAGILFANVQYTITGVQANSASGLLFANVQVTANGVQANSAAGTLTSNLQITITGAQANAQAGTATVVIGTNVNLTGVQANAQAGTVSVTGTANVAVTGVQANGQAGIVTANVQTLPAGVQANGAAGIVTANIAKTLTGVQSNSAAGLLFANVQYTIVGVQANAAAGIVTLSLSSSSNVSITGVQANAQAGTVTIITGSAVNVTGVQANAQAGSTTETGTANVAITGVQANSQIGTAIANVGSIILGSQANAQAGTVTLSINAFISGVQANSAAGIIVPSVNTFITGVQANSSAGIVSLIVNAFAIGVRANTAAGSVTPQVNTFITGVQANTAAGNVTLTISSNATISGVQANTAAGIVTTVTGTTVTLVGVQANTAAGTITISTTANASATGVQANTASGTVAISSNTFLVGTQANTAAGIVSIVTGTTVSPAGVQANTAAGTVTISVTISENITGVQANTSVGTITLALSSSIIISGVQGNTAAGNLSFGVPAPISGVQALASAGILLTLVAHPLVIAPPSITVKFVTPTPRTVQLRPGAIANNWVVMTTLQPHKLHMSNTVATPSVLYEVQDGSMTVALNTVPTGNS